MRKFLIVAFLLLSNNVNAQMNDLLGTLATDGVLTQGDMNGFNDMRRALGRADFQRDLAMLNTEIQTTFMGNYNGINKDVINFDGFSGINWNVGSETNSQYYVEFYGLDGATCQLCTNPEIHAARTVINNGAGCQQNNNHVKIFY